MKERQSCIRKRTPLITQFLQHRIILKPLCTDAAKIEMGAKTCSNPPYSLNHSFNLAEDLVGSPQEGFFPGNIVFFVFFPSPSYGGNMVIFGAIVDLVFYLLFDHVTPITLIWPGREIKKTSVLGNKETQGTSS
jgi:hypothetical protein